MPAAILIGVAIFTMIGVILGIITGLIPGIHVNTVAFMILFFLPAILSFSILISSPLGIPVEYGALLISAMIVGNLITHTFLDFIPSAVFGAPDEDMALSVLPAHRMMLRGEGRTAIRLSAEGSLHAVFIAMALLLPAYLFFGTFDGYAKIQPYIPHILLLVVSLLIAEESEKGMRYSIYAILIFIFSGIFGMLVLNGGIFSRSPLVFEGMRESAPIFSGLLGLFGFPALIQSMGLTESIKSNQEKNDEKSGGILRNSFIGALSGAFVGWFPGITSASATLLASDLMEDSDERSFITTMSAVNTSNAIFVILALFVIGKARSGALKVVQGLIYPEPWGNIISPPSTLFLLLFSSALAAALSYPATIFFGNVFMDRMKNMDYRKMSLIIIAFLSVLCLLFAGPMGMYVAIIGAMMGLIPPLIGINRVHLMGFLIMPVMSYFMGVGL